MITAEIIAIGSELLTPTRIDTNSLWLTERLNEIGIEVRLKTIVGDDVPSLQASIAQAIARSQVVITTGGLGPTEDDLTRQCAAAALGRELVYHQELLEAIRQRFVHLGYDMPEKNRVQALVIEQAEVLINANGTAPGQWIRTGQCDLFILPGPPKEMQPMFEAQVLPRLRQRAGQVSVRRKVLRVSGMGESFLDELIAPIYTQYQNPKTATLFNKTEVEVQLTAQGPTQTEADRLNDELATRIADKLGIALFALNGETMEEVVGKLLSDAGKTVAVAESCTGGLVAQRLTDIPGSSAYFIQAVVAYHNAVKTRLLGVPGELIEAQGAVSAEVAEAMACGLRERAGTDFAISTTGVAGPGGGSPEKPVGTVFVGYSDARQTKSLRLRLPGDRNLIRWRASQAALDYLRRQLLKIGAKDLS
ncbi:MAG: competence/damage-inducible protein A [Pirellulaceae bacterium]|nr:competence/damage-inducible protein A [Pirellulaceae bacterium]